VHWDKKKRRSGKGGRTISRKKRFPRSENSPKTLLELKDKGGKSGGYARKERGRELSSKGYVVHQRGYGPEMEGEKSRIYE